MSGLFSDFKYGSRSSRSISDLLTVKSARIVRAFNRSGANKAVALHIFKAFGRVWHGLLHKFKSCGISGQIFGFISSFLSNRQIRVVLDGKSFQEYPVNTGVPGGSILDPPLFLLYINGPPGDVMCNIAIYAGDTTLYSKCNQASDLWQHLKLASVLESDIRNTVDWGRKWPVDFNAGTTQIVLFDWSNKTSAIDLKMDGSVLEEKSFSSKLDLCSYIIFISKTASKKIGTLNRFMKFLSPEIALYLYKSTIRVCMEYCCHFWAGAPSCYFLFLFLVTPSLVLLEMNPNFLKKDWSVSPNVRCSYIYHYVKFWSLWIHSREQKSKYLENETLFFLQMKKFIHYALSAYYVWKIVF